MAVRSRPIRVIAAYLDRLLQRSSFARVVEEAKPYFRILPQE
jgi:hypothetical protein